MDLGYSIASCIGGGGIGNIAQQDALAFYEEDADLSLYCLSNESEIPGERPFYSGVLFRAGYPFAPFGRADLGWILKDGLFDRWVARQIASPDIFIGWAGHCLRSLRKANRRGADTYVVRASSHALTQKRLVEREYREFGVNTGFSNSWHIQRNLAEYQEADYILIPSDFVRDSFLDHGFSEDELVQVPFGVDINRFDVSEGGEKFTALFVGQVSLRKGVQYLLPAWDKMGLEDAELVLVGPIKQNARHLYREYKDRESIRFEGFRSDIARFMREASVFVFPSIEEGSALVTYEALAAGIPQVVTYNTGSQITDGREGWVVPPRCEESIQASILSIFEDRDKRIRQGRRARQLAETLTWERHRKRLREEIYQRRRRE